MEPVDLYYFIPEVRHWTPSWFSWFRSTPHTLSISCTF